MTDCKIGDIKKNTLEHATFIDHCSKIRTGTGICNIKTLTSQLIELLLRLTECEKSHIDKKKLCTAKYMGNGSFGLTIGTYVGTDDIALKFILDFVPTEFTIQQKLNKLDKSNYFNKLLLTINKNEIQTVCPTIIWDEKMGNINIIILEKGITDLYHYTWHVSQSDERRKIANMNMLMTELYRLFNFYRINTSYRERHKKYFIHSDIRNDNILQFKKRNFGGRLLLQLIDFGLSMETESFFMTKKEYVEYLQNHKLPRIFPPQNKILYKISLRNYNDLHFNMSPLLDIFCFICVMLETYLTCQSYEIFEEISKVYIENFTHILQYENEGRPFF